MLFSFLERSGRKENSMPWKGVVTVSEQRIAFVHRVLDQGVCIAQACREFGIARKTGHKWLNRYRQRPQEPLADRSRRPRHSPQGTSADVVEKILAVRDAHHWGAAKIHAYLATRGVRLPSERTVHAILVRNDRLKPPEADPPTQRFERTRPNELWQLDFKGPVEVQRQKAYPLTILDDHSRYLLRLVPCRDLRLTTAWDVLWELLEDVGMPEAVLCDNQFRPHASGLIGLGWFDARLIRLGIRPIHGRPYHPQTQGKVERLHRTLSEEALPYVDRSNWERFGQKLEQWRTATYNAIRPHQALEMDVPVNRWRPSGRDRPAKLPALTYPPGSVLRKVQAAGWISFRSCRIRVGAGVAGDRVRILERGRTLEIYYGVHRVRNVALASLNRHTVA
jgi:transposase InsO family protein